MITIRSNRESISVKTVLKELKENANTQFDEYIEKLFIELIDS